ncbi:hypothetical protein GCM10017771_03210 [Streptomyces capitiformicae]|uniref:Macro domain-containing protein n=1 Tax=Streptomyces capitiformicae TaxID=2014920 RepID=A0A919L2V9_9ACTN|nr:hypothetical protein GCM10017771_03210 [Streptomyces capitiformicae]
MGDRDAQWVIHTVGPRFTLDTDQPDLLASCYRESLCVADELGVPPGRLPRRYRRHLRLADGRRRPHRGADGTGHPDCRRGGPVCPLRRGAYEAFAAQVG